jgi:hypothetical protein
MQKQNEVGIAWAKPGSIIEGNPLPIKYSEDDVAVEEEFPPEPKEPAFFITEDIQKDVKNTQVQEEDIEESQTEQKKPQKSALLFPAKKLDDDYGKWKMKSFQAYCR